MFYNELDNHSKLWRIRLNDGRKIVGQLQDHTVDVHGHLLMIEIREGASNASTIQIPWHSVSTLE